MALQPPGVAVLLWYVWLQTLLLLLAQVFTHLLCHSLISMVDAFHTIYLFTQTTVFLLNRPGSGVPTRGTAPASPPSAPPPLTPLSPGSSPSPDAPSPALPPCRLPPPPVCGLSFPRLRARILEVFCSALLLATLSGTYFLEIVPQVAEPSEKHHPLVWTVVGAISIFHNTLVLLLTRARVLQGRTRGRAAARHRHESIVEKGVDRPGRDGAGPHGAAAAATAAVQSNGTGSLVFSNPGALQPDTGVPGADGDLGTAERGEHPRDASDDHVPWSMSDKYADEVKAGRRWLAFLRAAWVPFQDLFAALLTVIYGLAMLLAVQDCVPASVSCTPLVHLDVAFSALAIVVLLVCSVPQVYRCGLILLQACPPSVSVSELSGKITCIPGVKSLHHLHVWQLTETHAVASVHVRCQEGFQKHRCGDLILAITRVIQSVGVSCCTIQPEFALPPPVSADQGPGEAPSPPRPASPPSSPQAVPARPCGLPCENACEEKMCCSPSEENPLLQDK